MRRRSGSPAIVSLHAVHAIVESIRDPELLAKVNRFDAVLPDGQPVRWALNHLHGVGLRERVYGPELMLRLCARAADDGIPIYLYGSTPDVIELLQQKLLARVSRAARSPAPNRRLFAHSRRRKTKASCAGSTRAALESCLSAWVAPSRTTLPPITPAAFSPVQVCVGAAFDFHAGTKPMAPAWMQRHGLEWVYRLSREPRRLWRRYLQTNSIFLAKWLAASACGEERIARKPGIDKLVSSL